MNILAFGKDGQLGKAFQNLFQKVPLASENNIQYIGRNQCDLSHAIALNNLLNTSKPDLIINAAAYTAVDKAETEYELAFAINAKAPEIMAQYATKHGSTLLHYSTDYVFDGSKDGPYIEDDHRKPINMYGKSKAAGEEAIVNVFTNCSAGQYAIFRTSWVYGDGANFIRTILRLAKEREELKVICDQYGVPTNAGWLAQVSLDLVLDLQDNLRKFTSGIYHAVPSGKTSWHELAALVVQTARDANIALKLKPHDIQSILAAQYPVVAPGSANSCLDNSKLRLALEESGDMSKLQHWNKAWEKEVQSYVAGLSRDGLI
ncbi:dTDP-4-dehydrorhamnose reductase [Polynucleobacter hirudinilacicola]|uniref:dTDP-4-dehydrorhamnose reductase n=1 Tax=Polynucleobacter hirudinilacicola TaxID=1743166 RepID=A0A210RZ33_9BURK|nr:dTDP-4-dehydrorhamnose reductase [Polynucleobacter hirudinilacicola]OWF66160.1 dTDP-4-dehydrorhamnose reductase [Polynucleobacter hirudinilacicola]